MDPQNLVDKLQDPDTHDLIKEGIRNFYRFIEMAGIANVNLDPDDKDHIIEYE